MEDAIAAARQGGDAVRNVLPRTFNWPLFCGALLLMAAPAMQLLWHSWSLQHRKIETRDAKLEQEPPLTNQPGIQ
jgi:TRAP-type C4-dicarboxylate transport system permease small subunit